MTLIRLFIIGILFAPLASAVAQDGKKKLVDVVVRGEVIDTKCYMSGSMGDGRGEQHKECALKCAKAGVPLAILEEKTNAVYFTGRLKGMGSANELLIPFVGEIVSVKGKLAERGGAKMLLIDTVERVK